MNQKVGLNFKMIFEILIKSFLPSHASLLLSKTLGQITYLTSQSGPGCQVLPASLSVFLLEDMTVIPQPTTEWLGCPSLCSSSWLNWAILVTWSFSSAISLLSLWSVSFLLSQSSEVAVGSHEGDQKPCHVQTFWSCHHTRKNRMLDSLSSLCLGVEYAVSQIVVLLVHVVNWQRLFAPESHWVWIP